MDAGRTAVWVCLATVALAAIWDVAYRKIPNLLTLGGVALGMALHAGVGYADGGFGGASRGMGRALAGLAVCSILPVLSFARHEMGGGDVKLLAAVGALCGPVLGFDVEGFTFAILIAFVLPWRLWRHGAVGATLHNARTALANAFRPKELRTAYATVKLPPVIMAPSILAGFFVAMARHGMWFLQ